MNRHAIRSFPLLLWLFTAPLALPAAAPRDAQWKKVDEAVSQGLPQTAIQALDPIIQEAIKDKAYPEATKALARRIVLEGTIQGNKPEEKITRLQSEIAKAPKEMVPLLETILAHWYWHYFQQNRWRFMQRTATAAAPGSDFTTWDLPRLFQEIDLHFGQALEAAGALKAIPVSQYDGLLQPGTMPDRYRPTLYDFIAQEALSFYTSGEQAASKPEDDFELMAGGPIFDDAEAFLATRAFQPPAPAPAANPPRGAGTPRDARVGNPVSRALGLFQDLMAFHRQDNDPTAFVNLDLERLVYGHNTASGDTKTERYRAALERLARRWADHEISAMALHHWARSVQQDDRWVEARDLALRGAGAHPQSAGGRMCSNLVVEIEGKSARLDTERIWNDPWPVLNVRYRNVTHVYFRAVAWDWEAFLSRNHNQPGNLNENERKALLAKEPVRQWSAVLPPTTNYLERLEELPAPRDLAKGFYFIIASHDPGFTDKNNQVSFAGVWVSDLALILRPRYGTLEGFVLNALSGEPIQGAQVEAWTMDRNGSRVPVPKQATDELGFFSIGSSREANRPLLVRVGHEGDFLGGEGDDWIQQHRKPDPYSHTVFFTDRSLYRPGQAIQYKGICVRVDQEGANYVVLPGQQVTVVFADPNGKEIARQQRQANDYGSFSGSFTAPRDRVLGAMVIRVEGGPGGQAAFHVEEYKRPKFQVKLEAPKTAPKLNEKVAVEGLAEAYTGAAVDQAKVSYRVVREVRWPYWWGWHSRGWTFPSQSSQEIAHGTARTDAAGRFTIEFTARPDLSISPTNEPVFHFTIYADVTDGAGETRSDERSVHVGYTALQAVLSGEEWQTENQPVVLKLKTTTLDGEPQAAEGAIKIHKLIQPERVARPALEPSRARRYGTRGAKDAAESEPGSDPSDWPLGPVVSEQGWTTDAEGGARIEVKLAAGLYRAMLETKDRFGKRVTGLWPIQVLDPEAPKLALKIPHLLTAPAWSLEPGTEFTALWGTGYDQGRAFVEIEHRNAMIERFWTEPGQTQQRIKRAVTEAMRGGFTLHVTQVRENRAYLDTRRVDVPWSNKELQLKWEHFVSKLEPARKETWTAVVTGPGAEKQAAEMVATLYDESLDQFHPHQWLQRFGFFRQDFSTAQKRFANGQAWFQGLHGAWDLALQNVEITYRSFPADLTVNVWGYGWAQMRMRGAEVLSVNSLGAAAAPAAPKAMAAELSADGAAVGRTNFAAKRKDEGQQVPGEPAAAASKLDQVSARKNLAETAFFFPQLVSNDKGEVRLQFTMPEALTQWRFLGFAHDPALRSGFLEGHTVTAKELMIQPNPPRFLREGDQLEFTVKVSNQSATRQTGRVNLALAYALDQRSADRDLGNTKSELPFDIPAKESRSFSWRLKVPDGCGFLTFKATGASGNFSDGEEGYLPVLSRRVFITESIPLPVRGPGTKKFEFAKLLASGKSKTLEHESLTVQMVSNPAWYAVLALPYLMEFPHECSEQTFNRLYANALARHIAGSDPKIRRVFDQWKNTPALDSPMEKNQDLKSVLLEETPWLRQAQEESQARRNVGVLFDDNRLESETALALRKLSEAQLDDGSWPWFPGGRGNDYITLYITTGFGRLRHLGVDVPVEAAIKSLARLDQWMVEHHRRILKSTHPESYVPSATDALYLYGRSFFLKDRPLAPAHAEAALFFLARAREHWLKVDNRQSQGHLAIAIHRFNAAGVVKDPATAQAILRSIKERSVTDEEMGRFWRDTELSWWWYRAPIETQALMIEAFDEVAGDQDAVEGCRVWLLKQKQTQDWKTTKATADAVYALLLRGRDILSSDDLAEISLGGVPVATELSPANQKSKTKNQKSAVEPGTGFYERRFAAADIKPKQGSITVTKSGQGVAWGSVHWQYFEDLGKVAPHQSTPLKLEKSIHTKVNTARGPELQPVQGPLAVGDELVVRLELRVDRDMEYVHLKDQRGSGTEPVNVLSHYKYQDGLAYYETTRDTASHFFIDYLPKGVYVFEYSTRVQHRGDYPTGLAEIQCMYAPEFNSHSRSLPLTVR